MARRSILSKYNAPIFVKKEEIKKVFARIDEDTYWPNGYNVGEYQSGGHDFYVTGRLKSCVPDNAGGWILEMLSHIISFIFQGVGHCFGNVFGYKENVLCPIDNRAKSGRKIEFSPIK